MADSQLSALATLAAVKMAVLAQQWGTLLVELVSHLPFPLADSPDCRIPEFTPNLRELDFLAKKVATARHSTVVA